MGKWPDNQTRMQIMENMMQKIIGIDNKKMRIKKSGITTKLHRRDNGTLEIIYQNIKCLLSEKK